jgi:hypothetical protein
MGMEHRSFEIGTHLKQKNSMLAFCHKCYESTLETIGKDKKSKTFMQQVFADHQKIWKFLAEVT